MIESSIARRYAKALVEIGRETNQLDLLLKELTDFYGLCREHGDLLNTLSNRYLDLSSRLKIIDEVIASMKASRVLGNFLKVLMEKGRMSLLERVVKAYEKYVFDLQNKLEAVVTTAKPLKENIYQDIQGTLSKLTGKTIVTRKEIKPEVMGGISVQIGGEIFDGTIRSHLNKLGEDLRKIAF